MLEKRIEVEEQGESFVAGAVGNWGVLGSVNRGSELIDKINEYLPIHHRISDAAPGKPYFDGSVVTQAAANEFFARNPQTDFSVFDTLEPEDYFLLAGKAGSVWSDIGVVLYPEVEGHNSSIAKDLEEEIKVYGKRGEHPVLITGLGLEQEQTRTSPNPKTMKSMDETYGEQTIRFRYIEGKTRIIRSPALSVKNHPLNREVYDLGELVRGAGDRNGVVMGEDKPLVFRPFRQVSEGYDRGLYVITWTGRGLNLRPDLSPPAYLFDGAQTLPVENRGRLLLRSRNRE